MQERNLCSQRCKSYCHFWIFNIIDDGNGNDFKITNIKNIIVCVAVFVSFAWVSRDNKGHLCRPLDWNQQNLPFILCTRGRSCLKNAHSYLMNKSNLIQTFVLRPVSYYWVFLLFSNFSNIFFQQSAPLYGAPNENIVEDHLYIALLNVFSI